MIELKYIPKKGLEITRYIPTINVGITIIEDGRTYFDKWLNKEDW